MRCVYSIEKSIEYSGSIGQEISIGDLVISNDGEAFILAPTQYNWKVVDGPRRGIGANRNHIIDHVSGDYCLITDDDMEFPEDFIMKSIDEMKRHRGAVLTGRLRYEETYIDPTEADFWGYRKIPIRTRQKPAGFSDPVTWFPTECFTKCRFDESVTYGPTEMDFAYQIRFNGYDIVYVPELCAIHWGENRTSVTINRARMEYSRIYYMLRRYYRWERSWKHFWLFRMLEWPRLTIALLKKLGPNGIVIAYQSYLKANMSFEKGKRNRLGHAPVSATKRQYAAVHRESK